MDLLLLKKTMEQKIFSVRDADRTLLLVRLWARGRTSVLAEEFGVHANTLYAQYRGESFNESVWTKTQQKMREEGVEKGVRTAVLRYVMRNINISRSKKSLSDKVLDGKDL